MEHQLNELMLIHLSPIVRDYILNFLQGIQSFSGSAHLRARAFTHKGFRGYRYEISPEYTKRRFEAQLQKDRLYALAKRRCCQIV